MGKLTGKKALVKVSGAALTLTAEATTDAGDHLHYQITNTARRVLDPNAAVSVYETGVLTAAAYTVNRLNGTITFAVARGAAVPITVSGQYLPLTTAVSLTEWSMQLTGTNVDVSEFGDVWVERLPTFKDATGSLKGWRDSVDRTWENALIAGNTIVLQLFTNSANTPDFIVWALLNKQQVQAALKGALSQSVDWDGEADADNRVISGP